MAVTRLEAAAALGITDRSFDRWRKEPGFPEPADGKSFDIDAIEEWSVRREKKNSEAEQTLNQVTQAIRLQKLAEIKKKNELLQLTIDERNRDLLPREVVHEVLMEVAAIIRGLGRSLQQSGNTAAAKMIDNQVGRISQIVNDRLGEKKKE